MKKPTKPQPLLSPKRLAEYLDVPLGTIYRWRSNGTGPPAITVGKHLRYRPREVEAWLDEQQAEDE